MADEPMNFAEWEISQYGDLPEDEMPDPRDVRAELFAKHYHGVMSRGLAHRAAQGTRK